MAGKPWSEERRAAHAAKQAAKNAGTPSAPPRQRASKKDPNAQAVETVWSTAAMALMGFGRFNEGFLADSVVFQDTAEPMGAACAELAKINEGFADLLSKGAPATPYLMVGSILFSMGTQIAANHGAKLGPLQGTTIPRDVLIGEARRRMSEAQQQQEALAAQAKAEREWLEGEARAAEEAQRERDAALRQASESLDAPELLDFDDAREVDAVI